MLSSAVKDRRVVNTWVLQGVVPQTVSHSHCRTTLPLLCPVSTLHSNYSPRAGHFHPSPQPQLLITTDTTSTQQRGSTARAGDSSTTLPRTPLGFTGAMCPLGKAAKCKAALLTGVVHEQHQTRGCYTCTCLACHLQHLTTNRKQTDLVKGRHNLESTPQCAHKSVLFCSTTLKKTVWQQIFGQTSAAWHLHWENCYKEVVNRYTACGSAKEARSVLQGKICSPHSFRGKTYDSWAPWAAAVAWWRHCKYGIPWLSVPP